jgi:ATP-binding cassette subfamily B protein
MTDLDVRSLAIDGVFRLPRALWRAALGRRRQLGLYIVLLACAQLVMLSIPYLFGCAVDAVQQGGEDGLKRAALDMAAVLAAALVSWALHAPARILERGLAMRIRRRIADASLRHVLSLGLAWHDRTHSGETIDRLSRAMTALYGFSESSFIYIQSAVSLIGPLAALFFLSRVVGGIAATGYILVFVIMIRFDRRLVQFIRAQNVAERRYAAALADCLRNAQTLLTLKLEDPARKAVDRRIESVFVPLTSAIRISEAKWCTVDLINAFLRCGLAVLYGWLAWRASGSVAVGSLLATYQYTQQVGGVVGSMAGNLQVLIRHHADFGGLGDILREAPVCSAEVAVPSAWHAIEVRDLCFAHEGTARPVLADLDLRFERGRRIALVGESGSGKSTLLSLLAGTREPSAGEFLVDGRVLPGIGRLGTLVPQEPQLFEGTVLENLTLGIDRDAVEIQRACDLACFDLERFPGGLEAAVREGGANLSGGQRQRLALARAILAAGESSLLLLDEPTSSLDPVTEAKIYDGLFAAFPNACIVSSVHRLNLLDRFDEVVTMVGGRATTRTKERSIAA